MNYNRPYASVNSIFNAVALPSHPEGNFYTNFDSNVRVHYERAIRQFVQTYPNAGIQFHISNTPVFAIGSNKMLSALVWNYPLIFGNAAITDLPEEWLRKFSDIYKSITK